MNNKMQELGKRIQQIRKREKLSLEDFEKIMGVSKNTLSNYERGEGDPKASFLRKLAEYGNVSLDWLINGDGPGTSALWSYVSDVSQPRFEDEPLSDKEKIKKNFVKYCEELGVKHIVADRMVDEIDKEMRTIGQMSEADQIIELGNFLKEERRQLIEEANRAEKSAPQKKVGSELPDDFDQ